MKTHLLDNLAYLCIKLYALSIILCILVYLITAVIYNIRDHRKVVPFMIARWKKKDAKYLVILVTWISKNWIALAVYSFILLHYIATYHYLFLFGVYLLKLP